MRRIIVFADGTGNAFTRQESNVWRLFQAVDQSQPDQIARYMPGVGTSGFRPFALLDGATGIGVPSNVRKLYRFLCWNWRPDDEIWMFGFSRGAFTVRTLIGLIHHEGLVPAAIGGVQVSHAEMDRNAMAAWRSYRAKTAPSGGMLPTVWLTRNLRDLVLAGIRRLRGRKDDAAISRDTAKQDRQGCKFHQDHGPAASGFSGIPIRFLGIFDTVEAYGVPFEELRVAIDKAVWPLSFRNFRLSSSVAAARHALSLDDERISFKPIRFEPPAPGQSIDEVWFAGVHSDVGGGYPDGALSYQPLIWIAEEAQSAGLRFRRGALNTFRRVGSPFGPLHDSRSGLGAAYRYAPRIVERAKSAVVHHSVLEKMTLGSERYAPVPMPQRALVRMPDGTSASLDPKGIAPLNLSEAQKAFPQFRSITALPAPNADYIALMRGKVWWRRAAYLGLVGSAIATIALPWIAETIATISRLVLVGGGTLLGYEAAGRATWEALDSANGGLSGSLGAVFGPLGSLLPSYASAWATVLVDHVLISFILIATTVALYVLNGRLRDEIADAVHCAWTAGSPNPAIPRRIRLALWAQKAPPLRRLHDVTTRLVVPSIVGIGLLAGLLLVLNAVAVGFITGRGQLCDASEAARPVPQDGRGATGTFRPSSPCWPSGILLEKGLSYTLTMTETEPFLDRKLRVDVVGFESSALPYRFGRFLKRRSDAAWFQPIARIGGIDGIEWPLTPDDGSLPIVRDADFSTEIGALCRARAAEAGTMPSPSDCGSLEGDERRALRDAVVAGRLRHTLTTTVTAKATGELFLYVNDALVAPILPGAIRTYANNHGAALITVTRAQAGARAKPPE